MLVTKQIEIDMGHRVPNHKSKCRNLHGHRYKIEVGVDDKVTETKGVSNEGMVIDFGDLKKIMTEFFDNYDHSLILWKDDPLSDKLDDLLIGTKFWMMDTIPTAENLAKEWYYFMKKFLEDLGIKISYLKVWETPTSTATYHE